MNQKALNKVFVWGFLFLYLLVALISFCHAVQFFGIGNVQWMSVMLAFAFELGLALSLASILLSDENKKQTLPWLLMITLTAVQVIGNVYSVFRYISLSGIDYYQYLAKPLLFFMQEVDEDTIQIIVSWIMGAILPVVALMMTHMVASNIKNISNSDEGLADDRLEKDLIPSSQADSKAGDDLKNVMSKEEPSQTNETSQMAESKKPADTPVVDSIIEDKLLRKEDTTRSGISKTKDLEMNSASVNKPMSKREDSIEDYVDVLDSKKEEQAVKIKNPDLQKTTQKISTSVKDQSKASNAHSKKEEPKNPTVINKPDNLSRPDQLKIIKANAPYPFIES